MSVKYYPSVGDFKERIGYHASKRRAPYSRERKALIKNSAVFRRVAIKSGGVFAPFAGRGANTGVDATSFPILESVFNRADSCINTGRRYFTVPLCIGDELEMKTLLGYYCFSNADDTLKGFVDGIGAPATTFQYVMNGAAAATDTESTGSNQPVFIKSYRKVCKIKNQTTRPMKLKLHEVAYVGTEPLRQDNCIRDTANEPLFNASRLPLYTETYQGRTDIRCPLDDTAIQEFPLCTSNALYGVALDSNINTPFFDPQFGHTRMWIHNLLANDESSWVAAATAPACPYALEDLRINQSQTNQAAQQQGFSVTSLVGQKDPRLRQNAYGSGSNFFQRNFKMRYQKTVILPPGKEYVYVMELNPGTYYRNRYDPIQVVCRKGFRALVVETIGPAYHQTGDAAARQVVSPIFLDLPLAYMCEFYWDCKAKLMHNIQQKTMFSVTYNSVNSAIVAGDENLVGAQPMEEDGVMNDA